MLALALAVVVAAVIVGMGSLYLGRPRRDDEVERFHRARQMTTEWARSGVSRPRLVDDAMPAEPMPEPEREPADIS